MPNDIIQHISNYLLPSACLGTVFGCGVLYQKFRALYSKVYKLDTEFKKHCEDEAKTKIEIAATTAEILAEIRGLKQLNSELREDIREISTQTIGTIAYKSKR